MDPGRCAKLRACCHWQKKESRASWQQRWMWRKEWWIPGHREDALFKSRKSGNLWDINIPMTPKFFIGIDVSKLTLDAAVLYEGKVAGQFKIANSTSAVTTLLAELKTKYKCTRSNTLLCAEQMGPYNHFLLQAVVKKKYSICVDSPLQIKRSLGIQRGKSDAIDAVRIAQYAARHYPSLKLWEAPRTVILQIKQLSSLRKRLIKARTMFVNNGHIEKQFLDKGMRQHLEGLYRSSVDAINQDIKHVEKSIKTIIMEDDRLRHLYSLVTSVPSVGDVLATELLVVTNEFKNFRSARKFASYCGLVPYTYSSGTSLSSKPRVSFFANRELKSLFHLAALSSLRIKRFYLPQYFERKVQEGKHKMSVLNAMKNKLVHYIFACVLRDQPYNPVYPTRQPVNKSGQNYS